MRSAEEIAAFLAPRYRRRPAMRLDVVASLCFDQPDDVVVSHLADVLRISTTDAERQLASLHEWLESGSGDGDES